MNPRPHGPVATFALEASKNNIPEIRVFFNRDLPDIERSAATVVGIEDAVGTLERAEGHFRVAALRRGDCCRIQDTLSKDVGLLRRLDRKPIVVVSAMGKTTNRLLKIADLAVSGRRELVVSRPSGKLPPGLRKRCTIPNCTRAFR